jgi:hypothetical protein
VKNRRTFDQPSTSVVGGGESLTRGFGRMLRGIATLPPPAEGAEHISAMRRSGKASEFEDSGGKTSFHLFYAKMRQN